MSVKHILAGTLLVLLLLGAAAVATAQAPGVPAAPDPAAPAVTVWWGNTFPLAYRAAPPCACRSRDPYNSALLTCYGAVGCAGAQASRVHTWRWASPDQRAVRHRCPVTQSLCARQCTRPGCVDPCARPRSCPCCARRPGPCR